MAARVLVLSLAVLLAGFAAIERHDSRECAADSSTLLQFFLGADVPVTDGFVDAFAEKCRGSHLLATAANGLVERGRVAQAVRLSDEAIKREPRNYEGWLALAAALRRRGLDEAAGRALREARRLNPRFGRAPG